MADKKQEEKDSPESKEIARLEAALKEAHKARKDAESERDAAKQLLEEEVRVRPFLPGAEKGKPLFFALCRIHHSGSVIEPGQLLPFDPTDPPPYCNGFVEGEHYRKG
jgi:hypothetical protein